MNQEPTGSMETKAAHNSKIYSTCLVRGRKYTWNQRKQEEQANAPLEGRNKNACLV
jgi:hypothetical protein